MARQKKKKEQFDINKNVHEVREDRAFSSFPLTFYPKEERCFFPVIEQDNAQQMINYKRK